MSKARLTFPSIDARALDANSESLSGCASCAPPLCRTDSPPVVCWSRSGGLLSQAGNADAELKTRVSDSAADDFRRLAREKGMNTSELLRLMVLTRLYGVEGVARMTANQLADVAGVGPERVRT
jgi:hypothetical protein